MLFDLTGKVALVTGATGSIGRAIARFLCEQGATLALSSTKAGDLEQLAGELSELTSPFPCDLSKADAIANLVLDVELRYGKIDILVNNAGIARDNLLMRMTDEEWHSVMKVNLEATFRLMRSVIKGMIKRRYGRIINISSIVGAMGNAGQTNYAAAKSGLFGLSKSAALEVAARNITVNCVAPGLIASPMVDQIPAGRREQLEKSIPMGRIGTAEEVAAVVGFLAASEASYITGHVLHVNGGMAML